MTNNKITVRTMCVVAIMGALGFVLMLLDFATPVAPSFLKFDFSDLPAIITSFALGPVAGCAVEFIKNALHLTITKTQGIGELANFLIGVGFVLPAGIVYKYKKDRAGALIGAICGALVSAAVSFPVNLFITYPFYYNFMSKENIVSAYSAIFPFIDSIEEGLIVVNAPFTFIKGAIDSAITFLVYKKLSPILKGKKDKKKK